MGHTVSSQRQLIINMVDELERYGRALRGKDREIFFEMIKDPLKHIGAISYTSSMHVWALLLLSIMVEHEKRHRCIQKEQQNSTVDNNWKEGISLHEHVLRREL